MSKVYRYIGSIMDIIDQAVMDLDADDAMEVIAEAAEYMAVKADGLVCDKLERNVLRIDRDDDYGFN